MRFLYWLLYWGLVAMLSLGVQAAPGPSTEFDRALAMDANSQGTAAAIRVLRDYAQRGDGEGGFAWWMKLNISVRSRLSQSSELMLWRNRVEFLRDANRGDGANCAASGRNVLRHPMLGCDYAQELSRYLACTATMPPESDSESFSAAARQRLDQDQRVCSADQAGAIQAARQLLLERPSR